MRPLIPPADQCPREERPERCNLACKYNHFQSGDLEIHSWELKCLDCGFRQTIAFRSDEEDDGEAAPANPACCPFCQRSDLTPGRNPCDER